MSGLLLGVVASSLPSAGGDFESIATVTVGSGGASSISFSGIPSGYQHLQVRAVASDSRSTSADSRLYLTFNNDTSSSYNEHTLWGTGSTTGAYGSPSVPNIPALIIGKSNGSIFGASVMDILDYASPSKNKVLRTLGGVDANGSGSINLQSGLWRSTSAITSIQLTPIIGPILQHSTVALYGIKAP